MQLHYLSEAGWGHSECWGTGLAASHELWYSLRRDSWEHRLHQERKKQTNRCTHWMPGNVEASAVRILDMYFSSYSWNEYASMISFRKKNHQHSLSSPVPLFTFIEACQYLTSLQSKQEPALLSLEEGVSHSCPFLGMSNILVLPAPVSWLYSPTPGP